MLTNPQVACVLWIQEVSDFLVVNLPSHDQDEGERGLGYPYLNVRDLDNKAYVRISCMAFVTLPEQLCTSERNNSLVRAVLL